MLPKVTAATSTVRFKVSSLPQFYIDKIEYLIFSYLESVSYETHSSYSDIHQKRKELRNTQKRRKSAAHPSLHSRKVSSSNANKKVRRVKKRSEVEFNAYNNPNNHMSGANWKFDHKKSPWDQLMNKTMEMQDLTKKGHYRKHSAVRAKQDKQRQIDLIDIVIDQLPVRYTSNFLFSQIFLASSNPSGRSLKIKEKQKRLRSDQNKTVELSEKSIQISDIDLKENKEFSSKE